MIVSKDLKLGLYEYEISVRSLPKSLHAHSALVDNKALIEQELFRVQRFIAELTDVHRRQYERFRNEVKARSELRLHSGGE